MHKIKATIIACIDYRIQLFIDEWVKKNGYIISGDRISLAGGTKDLIKPIEPFCKKALLRQLDLSVRLHNPEKIILIDHEDCGAYAEDNTITENDDKKLEREKHLKYLAQAKKIVISLYPDRKVEAYYLNLLGNFEEV